MSTIEERVLSMKFLGDQFLAGVDKSLQKLDQLNNKLKLQEGTKGLSNIGAVAQKQAGALTSIADGVSHISDRFKTLGVVGVTALSNITTQALYAGQQMLKSITTKPIIDGFHEYETNLNAIQTILANTQASGAKLSDVTKALDELNHYSDQTIYNFSEMAKNIGTFTAAGVGLKQATASIKGIANLAALSGSNSQQASTAMYQLSQAISSGRVSLEDWNSVVNAGMGGTVFQRALAQNAEKMGTLSKGAVKLKGDMKNVTVEGKSFRDSITAKPGQQSWLTSDVLTRTLAQFTGDLTDAQLKAEGFNKAEIKAIQQQAKMAKSAATEVKTLSQLLGTISESVGSGWAQTWQTIFGNFTEAKSLFTNVNNVLGGFVTASANARNKVLADWKALGGRKAVIDAIANSFNALVAFVKPIKDAFREIFPATTGKQLAEFSKNIAKFTANLKISGTTANNLKRTFAGFFAILDIGWQVIKQVVKTVLDLVGVATKGSSGILDFTGNIGDFLVSLDKAIKNGDDLTNFFKGLTKFLTGPIKLIKTLAAAFAHLFDGFDGGGVADKVFGSLSLLSKLGNGIGGVWDHLGTILKAVWKVFRPIATKIGAFFAGLGHAVEGALSGVNYENFLRTINTGLFAGIVLLLKKFIDRFKGIGGGGLFDSIKESFDQLTGTLQQMQNVLKATTLLEIAAAVGILAASIVLLSKVDAKQLATSLGAITVMFGQLIGAMVLLQKFTTGVGAVKLPLIAAGFIILATAVGILASAVKKLAGLDWNGLAKGLVGVTVVLGALVAVAHLMPDGTKMINASLGMIAMATAVKILASAVSDLAGLSWGDLAKGLVGVGAVLGGLALFSKFAVADKLGIASGAGLLLMATAIKILASALKDLGQMSWDEIVKGLATMGGALIIITGAVDGLEASLPGVAAVVAVAVSLGLIADALGKMGDMSWSEIAKSLVELTGAMLLIAAGLAAMEEGLPGAAALIVASAALVVLGKAMSGMGGMSWGEIAKSLVELAGSLVLISAGLAAMEGALPGAAALIVAAGAFAILAPVLVVLGGLSWESIAKGLVAIAGVLLILGVAGAALSEAVPAIAGLAGSVALLGAAMALAGIGVAAFGVGLTLIAASGAAAAGALVAMLTTLIGAVPQIVDLINKLLASLLDLVINLAPKIGAAFNALLGTIITVIDANSPKIINLMLHLMSTLLDALLKYAPHMTEVGLRLITSVLNGIAKNMGKLTTAAGNVAVAFINGVSKQLPRIIQAGVNLVINFINGIANAIRSNSDRMNAAGRNLGSAIIEGMVSGLKSGVGVIASAARGVASAALSAAKAVLGIHSPSKEFEKLGNYVNDGFRKGLDGNKGQIDTAFKTIQTQISALFKSSTSDVIKLTEKLDKLKDARHRDKKAIAETAAALSQAKKEQAAALKASVYIQKSLKDEHSALGRLATQYDAVSKKLATSNQTLADAIKTRDDYNKQVKEQYSDMPSATGETDLATYLKDLQKQINDTKSFSNAIQRLRALGINDETYKDLLTTGTSALPFINELLAGGKASVDQINKLGKELDSVGSQLGKTASSQLYQAAVDSAKGLVDGLKKQQAAIEAQMDKIADAMVKSIKKKLGIKSPSRVFKEVGGYSAKGLVEGLAAGSDLVSASATDMGNNAIIALRKSLSGMKDAVGRDMIDPMPTITPVLDLSQIKKSAGQIGSILPTNTLSVSGAYSQAQSVSDAVQNGQEDDPTNGGRTVVQQNYTQNNYSPKALSKAEIYRQTKNQLSKTKEALAKS